MLRTSDAIDTPCMCVSHAYPLNDPLVRLVAKQPLKEQ